MGRFTLALCCGGLAAALAGSAQAQSLFGQPATPEPQTMQPPEGAAPKPAPVRRARPRGPTPAKSLAITNGSEMPLTSLEVTGEGKTASLPRPLAPGAKTSLKLPALKRCIVSIAASFGDEGAAEASDYNVCREKSIRFTN